MKYGKENVKLYERRYDGNFSLGVVMISECECPYMTVTTNIPDSDLCESDCAYVDTNNNGIGIVNWLIENKIAKLTGNYGHSGFCIYPEMKFDLNKFKESEE